MPDDGVIPTIDPQAAPAAGLPMAASPEAMGAPIGAAVEREGQVVDKFAYDYAAHQHALQVKADQIGATNAINAAKAADQEDLHGQNGLLTQNPGLGAPAALQDFMTRRDARNAKILESLPNEQQKTSFRLHEQEQKYQVHSQGDSWQHQQLQQADNQALATSGQVHYNDAIIAAGAADPHERSEGVNQAIAKGAMGIIDYADRNGWDKDRTALAIDEYTSHVSLGVLTSLVDSGDAQGARDFHAEHSDDFKGDEANRAAAMLKVSNSNDQALATARTVIAAGGNLEEQLGRLDAMKIMDANHFERARTEIVTHNRLALDAHKEDQANRLEAAQDAVMDPDNHTAVVPPSLQVGMDAKTLKALEAFRQWKIKGEEPKTDTDTFNRIQQAMADPTKWKETFGDGTKIGSYDLNEDRANLSPPDFKRISAEIKTIRQKVVANDENFAQGQVTTEVTNQLFKENGLGITGKKGSDQEKAQSDLQGRFMLQLHKIVGAEQISKQRPLTPDEVQEQAKKLLATSTWVHERSSWNPLHMLAVAAPLSTPASFRMTNDTIREFEKPGAENRAYSVHDIPADWIARFDASDKRAGIRRSNEERVEDYNKVMQQTGSR